MDTQEQSTQLQASCSPQTPHGLQLYNTAKLYLGKHLSGTNPVYGCAETINQLYNVTFGEQIGGGYSTYLLYLALKNPNRFQLIEKRDATTTTPSLAQPGDVWITPTGFGNGVIPNGHVAIVGKYGLLSNSSEDGCLHENYTQDSWTKIFCDVGGYPIFIFRVL